MFTNLFLFLLVQGNIFLRCYLPSKCKRIDPFRGKIGCTFVEASHRRLRSSVVTARGMQKQKTASHRKTYCSIFLRISYFASWLLAFWLVEFWTLNTPPVSYFCKLFKSYWSYDVSMNYTLSRAFSASTLKCIPNLISLQLLTSPVNEF